MKRIKDIKETLEKATNLQYLAYSRIKEILEINDKRAYLYHPVNIEFDHDTVTVRFENTNSDYLDFEFETLSLKELEMNDEEWNNHINKLKEEQLQKEKQKEERIKQSELEKKQKLYLELKKELYPNKK